MRVGFVSTTNTQSVMFLPLRDALCQAGATHTFWVTLDAYYQWQACRPLEAAGIPFHQLDGNLGGRRFIDLPLPLMYRHLLGPARRDSIRILDLEQPDLLIFGNDRGLIEKQLIRLARARGITTMLLQDGLLWRSEVRSVAASAGTQRNRRARLRTFAKNALQYGLTALNLRHLAPTYMGQGGCRHILAMGAASKQVLMQRGIPGDQITVVGQPRYDRVQHARETPEALRTRLNLPHDRTIITLFTSAFAQVAHDPQTQALQEAIAQQLVAYVRSRHAATVQVVIKPHPREQPAPYRAIAAAHAPSSRLIEQADSVDLIAASDLVITVPSTIIAEIALLRRPFIVLDIHEPKNTSQLLGLAAHALPEVETADQLLARVEAFLGDEAGSMTATLPEVSAQIIDTPPHGAACAAANVIAERMAQLKPNLPQRPLEPTIRSNADTQAK